MFFGQALALVSGCYRVHVCVLLLSTPKPDKDSFVAET
jgi:hypothetical protein